jgi:hypothetical protein
MKSIKSFDLFQKITTKEIVQPTVIGALNSLIVISLMLFLIFKETLDYMTPSIKKETIIYQDKAITEAIKLNFHIKLFNLPCEIAAVDQQDSVGTHHMNIKDNLDKTRLDQENKKIIGYYSPFQLDLIEKSINDGESCYIKGFITVNKAPGNIHISFHEFRNQWEYLVSKPDLYSKISMNHKFFSLSYGDIQVKNQILQNFGLNEFTHNFQASDLMLPNYNESDNIKYSYDYYVKLIPHIFVDDLSNKEYFTYEFSLSHKKRIIEEIELEMPAIMMNYDISPITMKITLHKKHFTKFIIHVCALVGGVFVIFKLINGIILYLFIENHLLQREKDSQNWEKK